MKALSMSFSVITSGRPPSSATMLQPKLDCSGVNRNPVQSDLVLQPGDPLQPMRRLFLIPYFCVPTATTHSGISHLQWLDAGHLIYLDVSINGSPFTSYAADGLILASPTGSTAYSFSAGGPIVSPELRCIVLTPISPHMLFDRSLVLAEGEEVEFVVSNGRDVALTIDGRGLGELYSGDRVRCRVAPDPLRLVSVRPRDFHQILKTKFALPDR